MCEYCSIDSALPGQGGHKAPLSVPAPGRRLDSRSVTAPLFPSHRGTARPHCAAPGALWALRSSGVHGGTGWGVEEGAGSGNGAGNERSILSPRAREGPALAGSGSPGAAESKIVSGRAGANADVSPRRVGAAFSGLFPGIASWTRRGSSGVTSRAGLGCPGAVPAQGGALGKSLPWEGPKWEKTQGLDLKPGVSPHSGGAGNGVPSPGDSRTLPGTVPALAQQCQALAGIYPGINLAAGAALGSIPHPGAAPFPADRGDSQRQGCGSSGSAPEPLRNCSEAHLPLISSAITIKRSPHPPALPAGFPGISGKDD